MATRPPVRLAYEVRAITEKGDPLDSIVLTRGLLRRVYMGNQAFYRAISRLETNGWIVKQGPFTWRPTSQLKTLIKRTAGHASYC